MSVGSTGADLRVQHKRDQLERDCVTYCHSQGVEPAAEQLDLTESVAYVAIVGQPSVQSPLPLVVPGDPEASYLMHKLWGTHLDVGGMGERMPMETQPLAVEQLERIETWILIGAPP